MRARHVLLVLAAFTALAIVWTWPVASHLDSRVPNDPGDPILNVWILWWNAQAVPLTARWWSPPIFVPLEGSLALSEHLLGLSVFATPLQLAGASPLTAYNVLLLASYACSACFAFLLGYRLTGSKLAAACAGVAFGFAPYRAGHLAHIQVLTAQWMPLMLLGMHGYVETGRRTWLVLFGVFWLLQSLSNGYYMLFLPVLIAPWIAWFTPWRRTPRRGALLIAAWGLASLPLAPVVLGYHAVHSSLGIARSLDDMRRFSATAESFLAAPPGLLVWPDGRSASSEGFLFPGATVVLAALAGVVAVAVGRARGWADGASPNHLRRAIAFYAVMAAVMYGLAFGPGGEAGGPPSLLRPYTWLLWLPGYDALRVPARFAMPATLCTAIAAACGTGQLVRRGGRLRSAGGAAILIGLVLDGATEPVTLVPPPQRLALADVRDARVLELPPDDTRVNTGAMYRSMFHGLPLVNGYSGHIPHHYAILSRALWYDDPSVLDYFRQDAPLVVVVNRAADRGDGFLRTIAARPDAVPLATSGAGRVFLLPQQPWRPPAPADGPLLPPASTRRLAPNRLELDLGSPRLVHAVEFALRGRFRELAERLLIETSENGDAWREAWLGWTGALAMDAALRDPRLAPVRIDFPELRARYLRIYPAPAWLEDEIRIAVRREP